MLTAFQSMNIAANTLKEVIPIWKRKCPPLVVAAHACKRVPANFAFHFISRSRAPCTGLQLVSSVDLYDIKIFFFRVRQLGCQPIRQVNQYASNYANCHKARRHQHVESSSTSLNYEWSTGRIITFCALYLFSPQEQTKNKFSHWQSVLGGYNTIL